MNYRFVKYDNTYEEFIYQTKKQAYKKYVEECFGPWDENTQRELFTKFIETVKDNTWLIKCEDEIIGFYNGNNIDKDNYEIGNICIIPKYQGQGIGTQILKEILNKHKKEDIHLQYFKQNPVGELYERLGFEKEKEKAYHYKMIKRK